MTGKQAVLLVLLLFVVFFTDNSDGFTVGGTFDGKQTRDAQGRLVGNGNLLSTLLIRGK